MVQNEDGGDESWAVELLEEGGAEAAVLLPWRTEHGAPKALDRSTFNTLVKMASETRRRTAEHLHATLHKRLTVNHQGQQWALRLDIATDEYEPCAVLIACNEQGERVAQEKVAPNFRLTAAAAKAWIEGRFKHVGQE